MGMGMGGNTASSTAPPSHASWFLQLVDLDIGWGHELLGFDDYSCLLSGLIYGIMVVCLCMFMLNSVHSGGARLPTTSRWFVAFMNLEIVLFVGIALAKLPKLCKIQQEFLPNLEMDCELLRFLYVQRIFIMTMIAGFGCWVFSSLAYFLAFGFQAIDRPEYADHLEIHEAHAQAMQAGQQGDGFATIPEDHPAMASLGHQQRAAGSMAPGSRMSLAPPSMTGGRSFARRPVGEPVQVGSRASMAAGRPGTGSMLPGQNAPRTSYNIPRASSSQVTSASSRSQAETQPFIKQPIAVF
jgi:hypothetical protein